MKHPESLRISPVSLRVFACVCGDMVDSALSCCYITVKDVFFILVVSGAPSGAPSSFSQPSCLCLLEAILVALLLPSFSLRVPFIFLCVFCEGKELYLVVGGGLFRSSPLKRKG